MHTRRSRCARMSCGRSATTCSHWATQVITRRGDYLSSPSLSLSLPLSPSLSTLSSTAAGGVWIPNASLALGGGWRNKCGKVGNRNVNSAAARDSPLLEGAEPSLSSRIVGALPRCAFATSAPPPLSVDRGHQGLRQLLRGRHGHVVLHLRAPAHGHRDGRLR